MSQLSARGARPAAAGRNRVGVGGHRLSFDWVVAAVGQAAVAFSGSDLCDRPINSSWARGRPVLIDFWASWCVPSRREQPFLNRINADGAGRGVRALGVDVDDEKSSAISFDLEFGVGYPSLYDRERRLYHAYRIGLHPSMVLVDRSGRAVGRFGGERDEAAARSLIAAKIP